VGKCQGEGQGKYLWLFCYSVALLTLIGWLGRKNGPTALSASALPCLGLVLGVGVGVELL
jgi:hypothetical protein